MQGAVNRQPNFWIDRAGFDKLVGKHGLCAVQDLGNADAASVRSFLGASHDTVGVFASGYLPEQTTDAKLAGIDRLRHEMSPAPGEPAINAYHYAVGRSAVSGTHAGMFPVFLCGAASNQTVVPHWPTGELSTIVNAYIGRSGE